MGAGWMGCLEEELSLLGLGGMWGRPQVGSRYYLHTAPSMCTLSTQLLPCEVSWEPGQPSTASPARLSLRFQVPGQQVQTGRGSAGGGEETADGRGWIWAAGLACSRDQPAKGCGP